MQSDYDAALAEIERHYPGINDDGSCPHGERFDNCPTCSPTEGCSGLTASAIVVGAGPLQGMHAGVR